MHRTAKSEIQPTLQSSVYGNNWASASGSTSALVVPPVPSFQQRRPSQPALPPPPSQMEDSHSDSHSDSDSDSSHSAYSSEDDDDDDDAPLASLVVSKSAAHSRNVSLDLDRSALPPLPSASTEQLGLYEMSDQGRGMGKVQGGAKEKEKEKAKEISPTNISQRLARLAQGLNTPRAATLDVPPSSASNVSLALSTGSGSAAAAASSSDPSKQTLLAVPGSGPTPRPRKNPAVTVNTSSGSGSKTAPLVNPPTRSSSLPLNAHTMTVAELGMEGEDIERALAWAAAMDAGSVDGHGNGGGGGNGGGNGNGMGRSAGSAKGAGAGADQGAESDTDVDPYGGTEDEGLPHTTIKPIPVARPPTDNGFRVTSRPHRESVDLGSSFGSSLPYDMPRTSSPGPQLVNIQLKEKEDGKVAGRPGRQKGASVDLNARMAASNSKAPSAFDMPRTGSPGPQLVNIQLKSKDKNGASAADLDASPSVSAPVPKRPQPLSKSTGAGTGGGRLELPDTILTPRAGQMVRMAPTPPPRSASAASVHAHNSPAANNRTSSAPLVPNIPMSMPMSMSTANSALRKPRQQQTIPAPAPPATQPPASIRPVATSKTSASPQPSPMKSPATLAGMRPTASPSSQPNQPPTKPFARPGLRENSPSGSTTTTASSGRFPLTPDDRSEASSTSAASPVGSRKTGKSSTVKAGSRHEVERERGSGHKREPSHTSSTHSHGRRVSVDAASTVRSGEGREGESEKEAEQRRKERRRSEAYAAREVGLLIDCSGMNVEMLIWCATVGQHHERPSSGGTRRRRGRQLACGHEPECQHEHEYEHGQHGANEPDGDGHVDDVDEPHRNGWHANGRHGRDTDAGFANGLYAGDEWSVERRRVAWDGRHGHGRTTGYGWHGRSNGHESAWITECQSHAPGTAVYADGAAPQRGSQLHACAPAGDGDGEASVPVCGRAAGDGSGGG
jgi:hypothetical protein